MRRQKILFASVASIALTTAIKISTAVGVEAPPTNDNTPIGRITASFGVASIQDVKGTHNGELHQLINNDDRIVTDGGGVSVLLASRVVAKLDAHSCLSLRDSGGQTSLVLEYGTAHVYVGERPA